MHQRHWCRMQDRKSDMHTVTELSKTHLQFDRQFDRYTNVWDVWYGFSSTKVDCTAVEWEDHSTWDGLDAIMNENDYTESMSVLLMENQNWNSQILWTMQGSCQARDWICQEGVQQQRKLEKFVLCPVAYKFFIKRQNGRNIDADKMH